MIPDRIPTEIIQMIDPGDARHYRIVPHSLSGNLLECFSCGDSPSTGDLEILYNHEFSFREIGNEEIDRLLGKYYRDVRSASIGSAGTDIDFLYGLIEEAFGLHASDIHIERYEERCRIRLRIDGKLIEKYTVAPHNYNVLVNQIKIMANLDISEKRLPQDGRILYDPGGEKFDLRVSCLPVMNGEKIVMRLLARHNGLLELNNLGFTDKQLADYTSAIGHPHGIILICGPTGSGKSTTLYATLRRLNKESDNIVTIEDPVEYTLEGINQVQLKEEIGLGYTSALRSFLRQDPDIIMLGEIRDPDTAQMAVRSSLTGHLIFSTIHTNSALGCISRLTDMGVEPYLISDTLIMAVAQRLVRTLCPACKREVEVPAGEYGLTVPDGTPTYRPVGCPECYFTGFSGRKAIYEVVPVNKRLSELIKSGESQLDEYLAREKITTLREAAIGLYAAGLTSLSEILTFLSE